MAVTATKLFNTICGDRIFGCYKITGDVAVSTTWAAPVAAIDGAWYQEGTDTGGAANNLITWSGPTITWAVGIPNGEYGYLFYVGI